MTRNYYTTNYLSFSALTTCIYIQGVQLYIAVYDEDTGTGNREGDNKPDELVDIVVINHNEPVRLQSQRLSTTGTFVSINVNITVLCAQNFEGSDCTQCVPGFTGPNCDEVDDCVGVSCGNGQCVDGINSSSCTCDPDFTGEFCTTNIDDCEGVDCSGNGLCVDGVNNFTCACMTGYSGLLCNESKYWLYM